MMPSDNLTVRYWTLSFIIGEFSYQTWWFPTEKCQRLLVGGFNPSEKYESQLGWLWNIVPNGWENKRHVPVGPLNHHFPMVFLWFSYGLPYRVPMCLKSSILLMPGTAPWSHLVGFRAWPLPSTKSGLLNLIPSPSQSANKNTLDIIESLIVIVILFIWESN